MKNGKAIQAIASLLALGLLAGCAGSSIGDNVQQSLEADPQLEESPPFEPSDAAPAADNADTANEPAVAGTGANSSASANQSEAGNSQFVGSSASSNESTPIIPTDNLTGVPADLQSYIRDLQTLNGVTLLAATEGNDQSSLAETSPFVQPITRREYARWLFESYNAIYADEPGDRLRAGNASDAPAFQDVSPEDPDFAAIQGLAEAGIIPSAFTGNSTDVNFRPDAPLTRADLILWKVPLDTRTALPTTTPAAVTTAWGFQDADSIEALVLRAIAADFQLGDFANFRRAFGYTTLFRPDKAVTRAEAAAVLWRFGTQTEGVTAADIQGD
ncbi:MAG: S-layer homology domain-containing protein [Leptolyngbya sp. SIOISBB]|nr:S-layer homology domain-containing protein [Leptolyngbya sp. SIOISBB]